MICSDLYYSVWRDASTTGSHVIDFLIFSRDKFNIIIVKYFIFLFISDLELRNTSSVS